MKTEQLVSIQEFCNHHHIETSFVLTLYEVGLIEIITEGEAQYLHEERIKDVERMVRLHYGLNINPEGIDAIHQLLDRVGQLQHELVAVKNRLRLYEGE